MLSFCAFPLACICLCILLLLSQGVAVSWSVIVTLLTQGETPVEWIILHQGCQVQLHPSPSEGQWWRQCRVLLHLCKSWLVLTDPLSVFLLALSFPRTVRIQHGLTGWVLWFCFRHVAYLAKHAGKCRVGACPCPAQPKEWMSWGFVSVVILSCPCFLEADCSCPDLFSCLSLSVPTGFISGFEKLEVTSAPCPAVVVSGLQAKWHLFGSWRSHPAIAWRVSLQVQSICNASVSKALLEESL